MKKILLIIALSLVVSSVQAFSWWPFGTVEQTKGNRHSQSFYAVKKEMLEHIYNDHKHTLYCDATWNARKSIITPKGFNLPNLKKVDFTVYDNISAEELQRKAERMEWEHIVPAQNFGKTFTEWAKGSKNCTFGQGRKFKGRKCAEQESEEFRYMYTDMYNLYPSIGVVNFLRAHFNMTQFDAGVPTTFGSCLMKISRNKVEPPDAVKGLIARTYLYMQQTYPRYRIGEPMRGILKAWDKKFPINKWECRRAYRIEKLQGNANEIVKPKCQEKGWYKG